MTYTEPHNAVCPDCDALLIVGQVGAAGTVTLDAVPDHAGAYRAHHTGERWVAKSVGEYPDAFFGMRRRLHVCVIPDRQLELSTEASPADPVPDQEREAACPAPSARSTPPEPSC